MAVAAIFFIMSWQKTWLLIKIFLIGYRPMNASLTHIGSQNISICPQPSFQTCAKKNSLIEHFSWCWNRLRSPTQPHHTHPSLAARWNVISIFSYPRNGRYNFFQRPRLEAAETIQPNDASEPGLGEEEPGGLHSARSQGSDPSV